MSISIILRYVGFFELVDFLTAPAHPYLSQRPSASELYRTSDHCQGNLTFQTHQHNMLFTQRRPPQFAVTSCSVAPDLRGSISGDQHLMSAL